MLDTPIQFTYALKGKKYTYDRSFYFYESSIDDWLPLETDLNRFDRTVSTEWCALHSIIVVAADTTDPFGPSQVKDFAEFGSVAAASAVVIDETTGDVLYSSHGDSQRSMASMTKLMTAYVLFQNDVNLSDVATYHSSYDQVGAFLRVTEGETMLMEDLMNAMSLGQPITPPTH